MRPKIDTVTCRGLPTH